MPLCIATENNGVEIYKCKCCNKHPLECDNEASVKEYRKIQEFMDAEPGLFVYIDVGVVIKETGYIMTDQFNSKVCAAVWRIQRELAKKAGFKLLRTPFM